MEGFAVVGFNDGDFVTVGWLVGDFVDEFDVEAFVGFAEVGFNVGE